MKKIILIALFSLLLSGCIAWFRPHRMDVEQGNIITAQAVSRLHPGMSESQVKDVMGNPVLINIFTPDRIDYVYTFQAGYNPICIKRVICLFRHGILKEVITN